VVLQNNCPASNVGYFCAEKLLKTTVATLLSIPLKIIIQYRGERGCIKKEN
jgi:hypothetical protein